MKKNIVVSIVSLVVIFAVLGCKSKQSNCNPFHSKSVELIEQLATATKKIEKARKAMKLLIRREKIKRAGEIYKKGQRTYQKAVPAMKALGKVESFKLSKTILLVTAAFVEEHQKLKTLSKGLNGNLLRAPTIEDWTKMP